MAASDEVGQKLLDKVQRYLEHTQDTAWYDLREVIRERDNKRDFTGIKQEEKVDCTVVLRSAVERLLKEKDWEGQSQALTKDGDETAQPFLKFVRACQKDVEIVGHVLGVCNNVLALCKAAFIPLEIVFVESSPKREETFVFWKFDHEGRPIYRSKNSREHSPPRRGGTDVEQPMLPPEQRRREGEEVRWQQSRWVMGDQDSRWELASVLVTDPGVWEPKGTLNKGKSMHVRAGGKRLLSEVQVRELREIVFRGGAGGEDKKGTPKVADVISKMCKILEGVFKNDVKLVQHANELLDSLMAIARLLNLKKKDNRFIMPVDSLNSSVPALEEKLVRLSSLANNDVLKKLKETLPKYNKDKQSELINELMTLNCRLLDFSDLRNVEESFLPRLFHRFCLFHWQQDHPGQTMYLDIKTGDTQLKEETMYLDIKTGETQLKEEKEGAERLPTQQENHVRFVIVSDTHGWDADMELPRGDILIHCGDVSFEASGWVPGTPIPGDFRAQMKLFNTPRYRAFQWIIMVPGNHDQPLFDIWSKEPEKLYELMPKNMIILQAYTDFSVGSKLTSGAAKDPELRNCVQDGAIWLEPTKKLGPHGPIELKPRKPTDKGDSPRGWIIAGTGVSLKGTSWSCNGAFQLGPEDADKTKKAAECLLKHSPYIVLSYGPPMAYKKDTTAGWDEKRGDKQLREALDESKSWGLMVCGHSHENHGVVHREDGKVFVNAANSTQIYVPARPPIVTDISVEGPLESASERGPGDATANCYTRWLVWLSELWSGARPDSRTELVDGWVPPDFIATVVQQVREKKRDEATEWARRSDEDGRSQDVKEEERAARERLSEFDVCGPAVQWGFQTIGSWFFALALTLPAYYVTGNPWKLAYWPFQSAPEPECVEKRSVWREGCNAFVEYPTGLWVLFLIPCFHTLWVQRKCLTYVIPAQVDALGRGFTLAGVNVSFSQWLFVAQLCTVVGLTDITTQSLFLVQVIKSVQINQQIEMLWKETVHQSWMVGRIPLFDNITVLFSTCLVMTLFQAVYIVLHLFPTHDQGVSYECQSMKDGYTTLASSFFHKVDYQVDKSQDARGSSTSWGRKFWHSDVLRIQACYGRMPALLWEESNLMFARVELARKEGTFVRYVQILIHRQQEFFVRLILLDILERAFKLEMQISVFGIDMALQPDQTSKFNIMNKQMLSAILVSFLSLAYAIYSHWQKLRFLWSRNGEVGDDVHFQNVDEGARNLSNFRKWRACYTFWLGVLFLIVLHCSVKLIMAFTCRFSLSNNFMVCARFDFEGTRDNRTLLFGNATTG